MGKETIEIKLDKKEFEDLLMSVLIGVYIREAVEEMHGRDIEKVREIENKLLKLAKEKGWKDIVEVFYGALVPNEKFCQQEEKIIEEFNEDEFWHELIIRLGQRDFRKEMTNEDKEFIKKEGHLPDRVEQYYKKYEDEFERYGIERLKIIPE